MKQILSVLDKVEEIIIVILLAFMAILNFANVFSRYLLSTSFSFTEEAVIIAFVWTSIFGISAGYKRYAHLGMSFITERVPRKLKIFFSIFSTICSVILIGILIYYGIEIVKGQMLMKATTPALRIPTYVQGLSVPVGGVLILVRVLEAGYNDVMRLREKDEVGEVS